MTSMRPTPHLYQINLDSYEGTIDYVVQYLRRQGFTANRAELDPYAGLWRFYEHDGSFVVALPHEFIDRVMSVRNMWGARGKAIIGS